MGSFNDSRIASWSHELPSVCSAGFSLSGRAGQAEACTTNRRFMERVGKDHEPDRPELVLQISGFIVSKENRVAALWQT
jgi:hypothetical protein